MATSPSPQRFGCFKILIKHCQPLQEEEGPFGAQAKALPAPKAGAFLGVCQKIGESLTGKTQMGKLIVRARRPALQRKGLAQRTSGDETHVS